MLKDTWDLRGWKNRVQKFTSTNQVRLTNSKVTKDTPFIDQYKLTFKTSIGINSLDLGSNNTIVGDLTPEMRTKTLKAAESAREFIIRMEPPSPIALREIDLHNDYKVEKAIPMLGEFLKQSYL